MSKVVVVLLGIFVAIPGARADDDPPQRWGELEGDVGVGFMGRDVFTTLQAGFDLREGAFAMGLQLRLRLRVADRGDEDEGSGVVRSEDWDEASDLAHILRYVSYRRTVKNISIGLLLGEHSGYSLGYGALVRDYASAIDVDHPHSGIAARVAGRHWQVDLFLDDAVAPEVTALRVAVRPFLGTHKLVIGTSGLFDFRVPVAPNLDDGGLRQVDSKRNLRVRRGLLGAVGLDVGYLLGNGDADHLAIYADGNLLVPEPEHGAPAPGLHLGARFALAPFGGELRVFGGLEYRRLGKGYLPSYVDLLYDVQRVQFPLTDRALEARPEAPTKLGAMVEGLAPAGNAWWGQVGVQYGRWLEVSAHYDHRPGLVGKALGARVAVLIGKRLLAAAVLERFGVLHHSDLGQASGLLVSSEVRFRPTKATYLLAQYSRLWHLRQVGLYRPLDQLNVAFGYAWGY